MLKRTQLFLLWAGICASAVVLQGQICPGYNSGHNVNLACEIPTATQGAGKGTNLATLSSTLASQLGNLPIATAVSGSGLTLSRSLGVFTASNDSLGTILTQRGETIGKHKFLASFTYQHFGFGTVDGIPLKNFPTVQGYAVSPTVTTYVQATSAIHLSVDQFTSIATFGLTDRIDVSMIIPFSKVTLNTDSQTQGFNVGPAPSVIPVTRYLMPGSATGIGDVIANFKVNAIKREKTSVALGAEVRFPTGGDNNFLGTGAYGFKPYAVLSRRGRITPNVNIAYQWNGKSSLNQDTNTGASLNLPASWYYSAGADIRIKKQFTLVGEVLGQCVVNGPRLVLDQPVTLAGQSYPTVKTTFHNLYAMDNINAGFKLNPTKHLFITASAMFKLDDAGLRSKIVPLAGASYRF